MERIHKKYIRKNINNIYNIVISNGTITNRETLLVGPRGVLKMTTIWDGVNLRTFYLYGSQD
jgi:hypothetical protein